jgi:hypothetical protein
LLFADFMNLKETTNRMMMGGLAPFSRFFHWMKTNACPVQKSKCPNASCEALLYFRKKEEKGKPAVQNFTNWEDSPYQKWKYLDRHEMPGCTDPERVKKIVQEGETTKEVPVRPEQKPFRYMMVLILMFTELGDLVIDPFCGVGSTAVACALTGRRFWGCDSDPEAVHYAKARLSALKDTLASGKGTTKPAYTWDMYKSQYYGAGGDKIESEDKRLAQIVSDAVRAGPKEGEDAPALGKEEEERLVLRLRGQTRGVSAASVPPDANEVSTPLSPSVSSASGPISQP